MPFKSRAAFQAFAAEISRQRRYHPSPDTNDFFAALLETCQHRVHVINKGEHFYRSRIGHAGFYPPEIDRPLPILSPHPPSEMKPPPDSAAEGRVNAKGIPVLYLATEAETAIMEVRPWLSSYITLGEFIVERDLRIIDCTHTGLWEWMMPDYDSPSPEVYSKIIWNEIDLAFSEPTLREDDVATYIVTQALAELFRVNGFDGIRYVSKFGPEGLNVALFNLNAATCVKTDLVRLKTLKGTWDLIRKADRPRVDLDAESEFPTTIG